MSTSVHQEVEFDAAPRAVYAALTQAEQHSAFTGGKSAIDARPGGAFSGHDGQIVGFNLELCENERIVQAWRVGAWPAGVYSVVRYTLTTNGKGTRVVLDHTGLPEGSADMIASGWETRYWAPMKAFLAG